MFTAFFPGEDLDDEDVELEKESLLILHNGQDYQVQRKLAYISSNYIKKILINDPSLDEIEIDFDDEYNEFSLISNFLNNNFITITSENYIFLKNASKILSISCIAQKVESFEKQFESIKNNHEIAILQTYESIIFGITEENLQNIVENFIFFSQIENNKYKDSDLELVAQIILTAAQIQYKSAPLLFKFVKLLNNYKINEILIENVHNIKKTSMRNYFIQGLYDSGVSSSLQYYNYGDPDHSEISTNLRRSGVNPHEICYAIRFDEVERLQEISGQSSDFDFNQKVPFSSYESMPMLSNCVLIEYAAFFCSIKCFKFLLINQATIRSQLLKFAIAGGSIEIIRLCEQNGCNFLKAVQYCIRFHKSDIFEWVISNKLKIIGFDTVCTFSFTGVSYASQQWYECFDCFTAPEGCCEFCARHCHKHHPILDKGFAKAYCDCGHSHCKGLIEVKDVDKYDYIENLILKSIQYCNFKIFMRLIELGANIQTIHPNLFLMAEAHNNVRIAKIALLFEFYRFSPKTKIDHPLRVKFWPSKEFLELTQTAIRNGLINREEKCRIS
ncbi:hypothetical protein TRFO_03247 [Tritrichomonas foetus]|uniref:UBR-type domain-containing protein n=1 Tax=Tritrichomonas foetus TaxID=1144522 RepID=A0A1J4KX91_9EUKA|nr:hypothetical protein TRFO_03247 [Tritrichomonas foetus]|eukprot:OHT14173.1 hypothetical protein TRFO_03247 [Tritrichomonas foetus]